MAKNSKTAASAKPKPVPAQGPVEPLAAAAAVAAPIPAVIAEAVPVAIAAPVAAAKTADKKNVPAMCDALFVKSRGASFRRAGWNFNREGHGIALTLLSDEQIALLENEPNLIVERCQVPLDEDV